MHKLTLLSLAILAIALAGCAPKAAPPAIENAAAPIPVPAPENSAPAADAAPQNAAAPGPNAAGKVKVVAYINVSSGCQANTVQLLNDLGIKYSDFASVEFVDFGDGGKGAQRWADDGLDCMTILFNQSPVLRIPGEDGQPKIVVFAMPEGFSWTHDDLKAVFAAMKAGKLEILTEEEARQELAPARVKLDVKVIASASAAELQISGTPVLTIKANAKDKSPAGRAKTAKAALDQWAQNPIYPSELTIKTTGKDARILAKETEIIRITPDDAKAAGQTDTHTLANQWLKAITGAIGAAVQNAKTTAG